MHVDGVPVGEIEIELNTSCVTMEDHKTVEVAVDAIGIG